MNNGPQFYQTVMGKQFFDGTMPKLAKSAASIAKSLEIIENVMGNETIMREFIGAMHRLATAQEKANEIAMEELALKQK